MARRSAENAIDWSAIERQFRLGQKTAQQLAEEFKVATSSITRRAKKEGWVADKSKEVAVATNALLIQNASGNANPNATPTPTEIKVAAQTNADVVLGHRKGLRRLASLRDKLIAQLEAVTDNVEAFVNLGIECRVENERGVDKTNDLYHAVISLPGRVEAAKKLSEIDEKVRKGEREAFGLDKAEDKASDVDELLMKLANERRGVAS